MAAGAWLHLTLEPLPWSASSVSRGSPKRRRGLSPNTASVENQIHQCDVFSTLARLEREIVLLDHVHVAS